MIPADDLGLYDAACAAARLAQESGSSSAAAQAAFARQRAQEWRTREVERWIRELDAAGQGADAARDRLQHAERDPDLDHLRGDALPGLPAEEVAAWERLWFTIQTASQEQC